MNCSLGVINRSILTKVVEDRAHPEAPPPVGQTVVPLVNHEAVFVEHLLQAVHDVQGVLVRLHECLEVLFAELRAVFEGQLLVFRRRFVIREAGREPVIPHGPPAQHVAGDVCHVGDSVQVALVLQAVIC